MTLVKKGRLDIISCGISALNSNTSFLSLEALKNIFLKADIIFASRNLLEEYTPYIPKNTEKRAIAAKAKQDAQEALSLAKKGKHVVALASGDALYNGFGSTISNLVNNDFLQNLQKHSLHTADIKDINSQEYTIFYHPNITAFQSLFHRLGLPWAGAQFFSAHLGTQYPLRSFMEAPLSVIYGGTQNLVQDIAKSVIKLQASMHKRCAVIAEKLGSQDEKIVSGTLEDLAQMTFGPTAILLLLPYTFLSYSNIDLYKTSTLAKYHNPLASHVCTQSLNEMKSSNLSKEVTPFGQELEKQPLSNQSTSNTLKKDSLVNQNHTNKLEAPSLPLGLPIHFYEKENNLITSAEVRAIALAKLQLPAWGVLWDIGAGSGSVGLEAASLRPHLDVYALEQKQERLTQIENNRIKLGICNYHPYHTEATTLLKQEKIEDSIKEAKIVLPTPDRVFIGGGGEQITHILDLCLKKIACQGIVVVSVVTTEAIQALYAFKPELRHDVCRVDIALEQKIAGQYHHLKPQNTIYLFTFKNEVLS